MGNGLRNFLIYTNPITIVFGIPLLVGIAAGVAIGSVCKNTGIVKEVHKDIFE